MQSAIWMHRAVDEIVRSWGRAALSGTQASSVYECSVLMRFGWNSAGIEFRWTFPLVVASRELKVVPRGYF
jgi:hypothetical protein